MNEAIKWVVVSNSNTCRIFDYSKKTGPLTLVKEMQHPENRLKEIELTNDKPGRYMSKNAHGAFATKSDPRKIQASDFSKEICKELEKGRQEKAYEKLIIIAAPRMDGFIEYHLNKQVKALITDTMQKDIIYMKEHELLKFLQENTF